MHLSFTSPLNNPSFSVARQHPKKSPYCLFEWTIVSGHLTPQTTPITRDLPDATSIALVVSCCIIVVVAVPGIPSPLRDCAPVLDVGLHCLPEWVVV
ncbi:hypothetical protein BKA82DRAFT_1005042 [Pisolithus tinctorius]|uniref:Uncharacterized protein n=1 Tax=Pisolithus tinctorius Marx 270 TaxID=870435 RepID=A0A0C3NUF4_PISTI|nr:hypothetical protein BKA82DRAFT_1005042 [Pisolithus tinctorius]KIN99080.1 hypothetical protein M404DRAFT_1005042 [Pisolithus tinctorius Marx 270]